MWRGREPLARAGPSEALFGQVPSGAQKIDKFLDLSIFCIYKELHVFVQLPCYLSL